MIKKLILPRKTVKNSRISETKGNLIGYFLRRLVHISMIIIPVFYYSYGERVALLFHLKPQIFLLILLLITLCAEGIRLKRGVLLFGQREYESAQISAIAWGAIAVILVLLFSPGREFSVPLIWSLALIDPLMGEMRRVIHHFWIVAGIGTLGVLLIWLGCAYWFSISIWWGIALAPVTVAVERLDFKWIDDNALMLLVPLIIVMIVTTIMRLSAQ